MDKPSRGATNCAECNTLRYQLEHVLQPELHLPHVGLGAGDRAESGVSVGAWQPGLRRASQNIEVRHLPVRMVQNIKRLKPELHHMLLVVRHPELLMQLEVDIEDARPHNRIPPDVAELPVRGFVIRPQTILAGRRRVAQIRADTGRAGTVVAASGVRVVDAADGQRPR